MDSKSIERNVVRIMRMLTMAVCVLSFSTAAQAQSAKPADVNRQAPGHAGQPAGQPGEKASPKATTPEFHDGTKERHERFNTISKEGKAKLVFVGDSITEGWEGGGREVWDKFYGKRNAANFGVSGDRTEHVLWRLDHGNFDGLSPDLVVIMIGTNNTGHRQDKAEDTAEGIKLIIERIQAKCPKAKILLLAVFPRGEQPTDPLRKLNEGINAIIKDYADNKRVFYKDIASAFLGEGGKLTKDIMPDFLHLTPEGYKRWADAIESDVAKLLGEKAEKTDIIEQKPAKADKPAGK